MLYTTTYRSGQKGNDDDIVVPPPPRHLCYLFLCCVVTPPHRHYPPSRDVLYLPCPSPITLGSITKLGPAAPLRVTAVLCPQLPRRRAPLHSRASSSRRYLAPRLVVGCHFPPSFMRIFPLMCPHVNSCSMRTRKLERERTQTNGINPITLV